MYWRRFTWEHKCTGVGLRKQECTGEGLQEHMCTRKGLQKQKCTREGIKEHKCTVERLREHKCTRNGLRDLQEHWSTIGEGLKKYHKLENYRKRFKELLIKRGTT